MQVLSAATDILRRRGDKDAVAGPLGGLLKRIADLYDEVEDADDDDDQDDDDDGDTSNPNNVRGSLVHAPAGKA